MRARNTAATQNRNRAKAGYLRMAVVQSFAFALISLGFVQASHAGFVGTQQVVDAEVRQEKMLELGRFMARADVAAELETLGVAPELVTARLANLTDQEIADLHDRVGDQVAGGDALALVGAVFLVLMILELVGVTDIFKSF